MATIRIASVRASYTDCRGVTHLDNAVVCVDADGIREGMKCGFAVYILQNDGFQYNLSTTGNLDEAVSLRDRKIIDRVEAMSKAEFATS